jgi:hypothetical protein
MHNCKIGERAATFASILQLWCPINGVETG